MMKKRLTVTSIALALVGLNACSDASTAPVAARTLTRPSFITVDQIPAGFAPEAGKIKVCKVWDNPGAGTIPNTTINRTGNDVTPTAATLTLTAGPYVLGHNQCANVATSTEGNGIFDDVTLTETVPAGHSLVQVQRFDFGGATSVIANGAAIGFNTFHGSTIVFTNHLTPPPPPSGCTFTKGWYQNKNGAPTILALVDGRTKAQQTAIFEASPGQPGGVTWPDGQNNVLNLYQQLLAALNNLGGNPLGGPASVDAAIAAALAATGGSGLNITIVPGTDVGALITPLSNFNEGNVAGFPHCD